VYCSPSGEGRGGLEEEEWREGAGAAGLPDYAALGLADRGLE